MNLLTEDLTVPHSSSKAHYTNAEKAAFISKWQNSKLSKAEFCRREGLHESGFYSWTTPAKMCKENNPSKIQLKPAKIVPHKRSEVACALSDSMPSHLQIRVELVNGIRIAFPLPAGTGALARLIKELACN